MVERMRGARKGKPLLLRALVDGAMQSRKLEYAMECRFALNSPFEILLDPNAERMSLLACGQVGGSEERKLAA